MIMRNVLRMFLFLSASCLVMIDSYALESSKVRLSECSSWAWFLPSTTGKEIEIALVSTGVVRLVDYALDSKAYKPTGSNETIRLSAPLGTKTAMEEMKKHWQSAAPTDGTFVWLFSYRYSPDSRGIDKKGLSVLLPCLHPDPMVPTVHLGKGNELRTGDMPLWSFWRQSRLFKNSEHRWLLLAKDTSAFLSKVRSEESPKLKVSFRDVAFPERLSDNPFLAAEDNPILRTSCRYLEDILLSSDSGKVYRLGPLGSPKWKTDGGVSDLPGRQPSLFAEGGRQLCVSQDSEGKWRQWSSGDGRKWVLDTTLPLEHEEEPVVVSASRLIGVVQHSNGFRLRAWKKTRGIEYTLTQLLRVDVGLLVDAMLGTEDDSVFVIVGKEDRDRSGLSLDLWESRGGLNDEQ